MPLGCSELQGLRLGERCFIRTVGSSRAGGSHAPENASDVDLQSNSAKTYKEKIEKKKKKKSSGFLWEEYYIASPSPEWVLHWVERSLPAKQGSNSLCFHCVTLQEATMQNNQQKGASGDTDASTNCLRGEKNLITSFALKRL